MGTCKVKLEQALNDRRSLLLVNKKLVQKQQKQESRRLHDEETANYVAKLERCIAALSLKCDVPNPFMAYTEASASSRD